MSEPRRITVTNDGLSIAALDWGGPGVPVLLLHPAGFCAGVFDPLAQRLRTRCRPIAVDLRGHGATTVPSHPPNDYAFARMATDVLAVLDHLEIDDAVCFGESLGGGVCVLVDEQRPGVLRRLLLCEAIAFAPDARSPAGLTLADASRVMSDTARRRRAVWPHRDAVRSSYGARPALEMLAPEALEAFLRWGFVDRADGQVELACPPDAEAATFEAGLHELGAPRAWQHLDALSAVATVVVGTASDLPHDWFRAQAARAQAPLVEVEGSHLFVQEDTERAVHLVEKYLLV